MGDEAGVVVVDDFLGAHFVGDDDGYFGGHGFEDDVAEGVGGGGEDEDVGGGVGGAEVVSFEEASEIGVGEELFHFGQVGAVADDDELGVLFIAEDVDEDGEVFFEGDAADVEDDDVVVMVLAAARVEGVGVDASGEDVDGCFEALCELFFDGLGGSQDECGVVVEPFEIVPGEVFGALGRAGGGEFEFLDEFFDAGSDVVGQGGVVGADDGAVGVSGGEESGEAYGAGCGEVDEVVGGFLEVAEEAEAGDFEVEDHVEVDVDGQAGLVAEDAYGASGFDVVVFVGVGVDIESAFFGLAVVGEVAEGVGDAVDFVVGIGEEGDVHGGDSSLYCLGVLVLRVFLRGHWVVVVSVYPGYAGCYVWGRTGLVFGRPKKGWLEAVRGCSYFCYCLWLSLSEGAGMVIFPVRGRRG